MSPTEVQALERDQGLTFPSDYSRALIDYPLPRDPHSTELWLCDDPAELMDLNTRWRSSGLGRDLIVIGGDGSEHLYVLDSKSPPFPVQSFSLETKTFELYASSFGAFVQRERDAFEELVKARERMNEAYANKRWWEFWIRPWGAA